MNRKNLICQLFTLSLIIGLALPEMVLAEKKLGQTGFQFLSVSSDARAGALAGAVTTTSANSTAMFFNPACMSRMEETIDFTASRNYWIADINYLGVSGAFQPDNGKYGTFGFAMQAVNYGEIQGTQVWGNPDGFILTEKMYPTALVAGAGYAKSLSDHFSVGGQVKFTAQQLGQSIVPDDDSVKVKTNLASEYAFDFGTLYRTNFKSLVFGMSVRNFSGEVTYEQESFQLPLLFTMGISIDLMDFVSQNGSNSLLFSVDALHPRSYPEQLKFGLEYSLAGKAFVRAGYHLVSDEQKLAFGCGIKLIGIELDYAYTPFGVFDNVQRITLRFSI